MVANCAIPFNIFFFLTFSVENVFTTTVYINVNWKHFSTYCYFIMLALLQYFLQLLLINSEN